MRRFAVGALALVVLVLSTNAHAQGVSDERVAAGAAIQAFKLDFSYTNVAAYTAARSTAYATQGIAPTPSLVEGEFYWDNTLNTLRCYGGAVWADCAGAPGGSATLDDAYTAGQTIGVDLNTVQFNDARAGATATMSLNRTAGTGAVLNIDNTGTGNDVTGDFWSVNTNGQSTFTRVALGDDQSLVLGDSDDALLMWSTGLFTDTLALSMAASSVFNFCDPGAGCDIQLHSGTGGDLWTWDASAKLLYATDVHQKLGDSDKLYLGTATGAANVDGDFEVYYDGSDLYFYPLAVGDGVIFGQNAGNGVDVTIHGDGATASAKFDYNAAGDRLLMSTYVIQMADSTGLVFGSGSSPTGDMVFTYDGAGNTLTLSQTVAGTGSVLVGADDEGPQVTFYGDTASNSLLIDAANDACTLTSWDIHYDDNSKAIFGSGAGATGDMSWQYAGGTDTLTLSQTVAGTGAVAFGADDEGPQVTFYGDTASNNLLVDAANDGLLLTSFDAKFDDNSLLRFGSGAGAAGDMTLQYIGGTNILTLGQVVAGTGAVDIGVNSEGPQVTFFGDTAGDSLLVDAANDKLYFVDFDAHLNDDGRLILGTGSDLLWQWDEVTYAGGVTWGADGQTKVAHITQAAPDSMIVWGIDGAGINQVWPGDTANSYLYLNQTADRLEFDAFDAIFGDSDVILFGDGAASNGDMTLSYAGGATNVLSLLQVAAGTGTFAIGADGSGIDSTVYGETAGDYIKWDQDTDPVGAGNEAALQFVGGPDIHLDASGDIVFGATDVALPVDGVRLDGAATALYVYGVAGGAESVIIGHNGAAKVDTDFTVHSTGGTFALNHGADTATFTTTSLRMADDTTIGFGAGGGSGPNILVDWDAAGSANLLFDTSGDASATVQLGTSAANHHIALKVGTTNSVTVTDNTTKGESILFMGTAQPTNRMYLPASSFVAGTPNHDPAAGATADVYQGRLGAGVFGGWVMANDAVDDEIDTIWTPDFYVEDSSDVTAKIQWYNALDEGACLLSWELCYAALDVEAAAGARSLATGALTCVEVDFTYNAASVAFEIERTAAITIPAAAITRATSTASRRYPVVLQVRHDDDDAHETCTGDVVFLGLEMNVARAYGD